MNRLLLEHLPTLGTEEPVRLGGGVTGGTIMSFVHTIIILLFEIDYLRERIRS